MLTHFRPKYRHDVLEKTSFGDSHQSPRPLSLRLFLVSLVMSGAAGQCVWLMLPSEDPGPAPALSWEKAFSSREGVRLSLGSDSTAPPTGPSAPPSSSGKRLGGGGRLLSLRILDFPINIEQNLFYSTDLYCGLKVREHYHLPHLSLLALCGEVRRCKADAAEAIESVWRAGRAKGSKLETSPR